jgi:vacuolar-type H+-ATPase subunit D/Vma8
LNKKKKEKLLKSFQQIVKKLAKSWQKVVKKLVKILKRVGGEGEEGDL